ncbi:MAG: hypothetical protein PHO56_01280 [Patescibacteria group bacterium]|nr:hypothetical protein [Patescibacteria group bacterium]
MPRYNVFLAKPAVPVHLTSIRLDCQLEKDDLISGRLLLIRSGDNYTFYYKVVDLRGDSDVFIAKTRMTVGKNYRRKKKIAATNPFCSCWVLRPMKKFNDETKTRPAMRRQPCHYPAAR